MVSEEPVLPFIARPSGWRRFGELYKVNFAVLLFIVSVLLSCDLTMPPPDDVGSATSAQNVPVTQPTVITVPVNIPLPEKLDLSGGNLKVKWQRFRRSWSNYEIAAQLRDSENQNRNKERRPQLCSPA